MEYNWNKITKEKLEQLYYDENLSDNAIAKIYNIKPSQVKYKRHKFNIKLIGKSYRAFENNDEEFMFLLNEKTKNRLLQYENISQISKVLTKYIFRDGPVEDMHANGNLSEEDMKTLNKFMVNKIAGIIKLLLENQWIKLGVLIDSYGKISEWDKAEPDTEEIEQIYNHWFNKIMEGGLEFMKNYK